MTDNGGSIEKRAPDGGFFNQMLFMGKFSQFELMYLKPYEEVGNQVHPSVDQFFRIEEGEAKFIFNGKVEYLVCEGDAVLVPGGTFLRVVNASPTKPLKLNLNYTRPRSLDGAVHRKAETQAPKRQ